MKDSKDLSYRQNLELFKFQLKLILSVLKLLLLVAQLSKLS